MLSDNARAKSAMAALYSALEHALKLGINRLGLLLMLICGMLAAGCSITIGPPPTPAPGEPTWTPVQVIQVDITRVPSPTIGPPTPTAGPVGAPIEYTIKSGDTLSGIAEEFGVTVEEIVRFNNLADPNAIFEGQVILIPPPGVNTAPQPSATPGDVIATATSVP